MVSIARALFGAAFLAAAALALGSCSWPPGFFGLPFGPTVQGWSAQDLGDWYDGTQGSRLVPQAWLVALRQPEGSGAFLDEAFIAEFGYLPRSGKLPVGFALDATDDKQLVAAPERRPITRLRWKNPQNSSEPWVGFACSACHTTEMTYNGARIRVEGGPARVDFQSFLEALETALQATLDQPARFQAFASAVLGPSDDTTENRALLKQALGQWLAWQMRLERMNCESLAGWRCASAPRYGYGRLDAFGHIFNKVEAVSNLSPTAGNPANAPVRYPALWNVPQEDYTQWNASVKELPITVFGAFDIGAISRNLGEVIGVFGDIEPVAKPGLAGFKSSANDKTLTGVEPMLARLQSPRWPSEFPPLDPAKVAEGQALYGSLCADCHAVIGAEDKSTPIHTQPTAAQLDRIAKDGETDRQMACNAYVDSSPAGILSDTPEFIVAGASLGPNPKTSQLLDAIVTGALLGKKGSFVADAIGSWAGFPPRPVVAQRPQPMLRGALRESAADRNLRLCSNPYAKLYYKQRPLNGVWASAPYLHNGSVPTLYDLLHPDHRPAAFWTGSHEFDPVNVGYVTAKTGANDVEVDTRVNGNSNAGHDYGASKLTEKQRAALLEYLKSL